MGSFETILTDIGDNQSIENQLSTYSYRLNRMRSFLEIANAKSLLLLDEFGTGSDPELGGALAEVFFEELYARKSYAVITTHYANIKSRAAQMEQAINGSMRFDRDSLQPLFKLDIGPPGSSFTFEVASINGISEELIQRAKGKLDKRKVRLDELISELQSEKNTFVQGHRPQPQEGTRTRDAETRFGANGRASWRNATSANKASQRSKMRLFIGAEGCSNSSIVTTQEARTRLCSRTS
jgi:DNA mismatch repair protein MutS2